jgi:hypothetical protein
MKRIFSFILFLSSAIPVFSNIPFSPGDRTDTLIHINAQNLEAAPRTILVPGQQGTLKSIPFKMDIGLGITNCILLEVPGFKKDSIYIEIRSLVDKSLFFYPVILKLTSEFKLQDIIQESVRIDGSDINGMGFSSTIGIDMNTRYILITTDPSLVTKSFTHVYKQQNSIPFYTGSTLIIVPMPPATVYKDIVFSDVPKFIIQVPSGAGTIPFKRENGFYMGLGVSFGGDKVADNPGGDDYKVGGGGIMNVGYTHSIYSSNFVGRYGAGFRYQGNKDGDARNMGFLTEALITYQTRYINFGAGGQFDFASSIKNTEGKVFNFKPQVGPKFILEWRFKGIGNIGIEYIVMDCTTKDDKKYSGNRIGIMMRFFFGK